MPFFDEVQANSGTVGTDSHTRTFYTMSTYMHYPVPPASSPMWTWKTEGLPLNYPCGGEVCGQNFGTPLGDHGKVCVACRDIYYSCKSNYNDEVEDHKVRYCKLKIWKTDSDGNWVRTPDGRRVEIVCPHTYRDCTPRRNLHTWISSISSCMEKPFDMAPSPPHSLTLTPGVTTIELRWTAPERSGSSDITDYKYRYRRDTLGYDPWLTEWLSAGTGFSKTITDLDPGKKYSVELCAVNSAGESVAIYESVKTKAFSSSLSLRYNSSTGSVRLTATANAPIYGADPYIRSPGDTSKYGTKIGWTSGNSNRTTYSLPVTYTFPSTAASGRYKFTLRVYPFNNSGSGNAWGDPVDVSGYVTVE